MKSVRALCPYPTKFDDWITSLGFASEEKFLQASTSNTTYSNVGDLWDLYFSQHGYSGSFADNARKWMENITGYSTFVDGNEILFDDMKSCTFFKNYQSTDSVNADHSVGSGTGTFTRVACACTYTDPNGIINQVSEANTPRFQGGYYDATGFHSQSGLMIEARAGTGLDNLIPYTDGSATVGQSWSGWTVTDTLAGAETVTKVNIPELTSISSATSQRLQYTATAGDAAAYLYFISSFSDANSAVNGNAITVSAYLKKGATQAGVDVKLGYYKLDANNAVVGSLVQSSAQTLLTTWGRFSYSSTIADATGTISSIDGNATTITVVTAASNTFQAGARIVITGTTNYNGTYTIDTITNDTTFTIADTGHNVAAEAAGTVTNPVNKIAYVLGISAIANGDIVDTYIALPQGEIRPYATSYVPTAGTSGTRNYDVLKFVISGNRTLDQESIFIKFAPYSTFANDAVTRYLMDTETSRRTIMKLTTAVVTSVSENGARIASSTTTPLANTSYVVGVAIQKTGNHNKEIYINGVSQGVPEDTDMTDSFGANFSIGSDKDGVKQINGIIQSIACFSDLKDATSFLNITNIINS